MSEEKQGEKNWNPEQIAAVRGKLERVRDSLRITKVVATRSVKGPGGDTFVGFSAAFHSSQEDGMRDLDGVMDEPAAVSETSLDMEGAQMAAILLSREVDVAAYRAAAAGGTLSVDVATSRIRTVRENYSRMIEKLFSEKGSVGGEK